MIPVTASGFAVALSALLAVSGVTVDRTMNDPRITEASGLAASTRHPGVLWTHNDSGDVARLFALGPSGATVATLRISGVQATDWEALAPTRDASGRSLLAIGDIGDNGANRPEVHVVIGREPTALVNSTAAPVRVLRLRYPGGAVDAETLVADPRTRRLYIVSKKLLGADLYAVPAAAWPGAGGDPDTVWTLEHVAGLGFGLATDGAFLPDGRLLVRNYNEMAMFVPPERVSGGRLKRLDTVALPAQRQGEALAVGPGARWLLITSEGAGQQVLRVPLPTASASAPVTTAPPTAAKPTAAAAEPVSAERKGGPLLLIAGILSSLALLLGLVVTALKRPRRRSPG